MNNSCIIFFDTFGSKIAERIQIAGNYGVFVGLAASTHVSLKAFTFVPGESHNENIRGIGENREYSIPLCVSGLMGSKTNQGGNQRRETARKITSAPVRDVDRMIKRVRESLAASGAIDVVGRGFLCP
jgi:hypothetical protein